MDDDAVHATLGHELGAPDSAIGVSTHFDSSGVVPRCSQERLRVLDVRHGNYADAAASPTVHRGTLRYRMQRIHKITDRVPADVNTRHEMTLHVQISRKRQDSPYEPSATVPENRDRP